MTDLRTTLEGIERRVSMPEPAMDRLLRRRERRQRNERIAAAAVGLGVAVAGIAGALVTLRVTGGTRPAAEGGQIAHAFEGEGFVLPTVVIWTAVVVLGLTVFAAVRLRRRLVHDVDAEPEGREGRGPGRAAAPARRPAAEPGTARRKGGSEMESKPKADVVGIPGTEMPGIRFDDGRLRRTNRWLVAAVVVLALAVVALGAALIAQAGEEAPAPSEPLGPASTEVVRALEANMAAMNAGDAAALAADYADNAVVTDTIAGEFRGVDEIVDFYIEPTGHWQLERVSEVVEVGDLSAFAFTYYAGSGIVVYQLDDDLKIVHQWIMGT